MLSIFACNIVEPLATILQKQQHISGKNIFFFVKVLHGKVFLKLKLKYVGILVFTRNMVEVKPSNRLVNSYNIFLTIAPNVLRNSPYCNTAETTATILRRTLVLKKLYT